MAWRAALGAVYRQSGVLRGRAGRAEFWTWVAYQAIALLLLSAFVGLMLDSAELGSAVALLAAWGILHIPAHMSVTVRRLHDRDLSGLWLALVLVPLAGPLALLILCAGRGSPGPNRFGP